MYYDINHDTFHITQFKINFNKQNKYVSNSNDNNYILYNIYRNIYEEHENSLNIIIMKLTEIDGKIICIHCVDCYFSTFERINKHILLLCHKWSNPKETSITNHCNSFRPKR
jgi:hypothetical protein